MLGFFRKYQKTMLAVAAVGAMFAFGILPIVSQYQQVASGGGKSPNATAISWAGNSISGAELDNLRQVRAELVKFQQAVAEKTFERGGRPKLAIVSNTNSEASIIETMMLADEASKLGITVGDDAVIRYLTQDLANDTVDGNQLAYILKENTRLKQPQMFQAMRTELAAYQMRVLLGDGSVTPGQAFDYFKRLQRRVQAEVIEIPVEDYVAQVSAEPTSAEVQELYDEYKDVFPSATQPTPGFKEPPRAAFEWVKADFALYLEREIDKVTDEEIQARYEQDKETYKRISLPATDLTLPDTEETEALDDPDLLSPIDPAEDDSVEDATSAEESSQPAETTEAEEENATGTEGGSAEEGAVEDPETPETEESVDPASPADVGEKPEAQDGADLGGYETKYIVTQESTDPTDDVSAAEEPSSDETTSTDTAESESEEVEEYIPLEEVRDEIATKIARPRATDAARAALEKVDAAMAKYFREHLNWDLGADEELGPKPPMPDLKAMADELGMIHGTIGLITALEADQYELGRSYELDVVNRRVVPFQLMGFSPNLSVYKGRSIGVSADPESRFQFWKTDQKEAYTPTLEEARPKVVKHWKMKKAIDIAKKAAEEKYIAKLAADQSLASAAEAGVFGEDAKSKVVDTNEFTWMSGGSTLAGQGPPRQSTVEGVKVPGEDFMRAVTKLNSGESTVAVNNPETHVYVVYAKGVTGSDEDLRNLFWQEGMTQPVQAMAQQDNMNAAREWFANREKELGVDWSQLSNQ